MAEPEEIFQSLSLEDDGAQTNLAGTEEEASNRADDGEVAAIVVQPIASNDPEVTSNEPATLVSGQSSPEATSMERSMERTVNLPHTASGLVSLSPVDERDLIITVSEPRIQGPGSAYSGPYVTYCITTRTSRQTFDKTEYVVRRRYQDFVWLRDQLADTYVTHIVPPLPDKHSLSRLVVNDHFMPEFLHRRKAALQKFLSRCTEHPTMSFDRTLMAFLIADDVDFQTLKSKGVGLMNKVTSSMRQVASNILLKNPDPEFAALYAYFNSLSKHLAEIEASAGGILQDGSEEVSELATLSKLCEQWASYDRTDRDVLHTLSESFKATGEIAFDMHKELSPAFAPFHEYSLFCDSAKDVLKRRETLQMHHALAIEDLISKQAGVENAKVADMSKSVRAFLFSNPETLKAERIEQAEKAFLGAQAAAERANDDMECANEHLRADMTRWQRVKKSDMASTFVDIADIHIAHLQKSMGVWQTTLQKLEEAGQQSSSTASAPQPDT